MPQIKQSGTDNILACWQGFYSAGLVVRAAFQCTLTYVAPGRYKLSLAPTSMDDENMAIQIFAQVAPGSAAVYETHLVERGRDRNDCVPRYVERLSSIRRS